MIMIPPYYKILGGKIMQMLATLIAMGEILKGRLSGTALFGLYL
jgi:hypothetical protein